MNIISFSLYGSDQKYIVGAIENAKLLQKFSAEWTAFFYCGQEISNITLKQLESLGSKVIVADAGWHENGMFWRFYPFGNEKFTRMIVRDVDSRISIRELDAVQEWVESGKLGHIMRDHPFHATEILGGMWGARYELGKHLDHIDSEKSYSKEKGQDQYFLRDRIYPTLVGDSLIHDSFFKHEKNSKKFRILRKGNEYVGEVVQADGSVDNELREKVRFFEKHQYIWKAKRALSSF